MEEEQTKASTNKTTQKEQKKSEKDKNGTPEHFQELIG